MSARDEYIRVFGQIETLAEPISWSTGVSNLFECLTWSTSYILGISKTAYIEWVVELCHDDDIREMELEEKLKYVKNKIDTEIKANDHLNRYDPPPYSICSPREALRYAKYFLEEYLNKEFDIFWTLVSDKYLDQYYGQFIKINEHGKWFTHGNSGLFAKSTSIREMQMDNLSYNPVDGILIANELKLGGKKNPDQILKYSLMFILLRERGFIKENTRFLLLFISDKLVQFDWKDLIDKEISYCQKSKKPSAKKLIDNQVIEIAKSAKYASTTWKDLISFNDRYITTLNFPEQQVEYKLIWGFNDTLSEKAFLQEI